MYVPIKQQEGILRSYWIPTHFANLQSNPQQVYSGSCSSQFNAPGKMFVALQC